MTFLSKLIPSLSPQNKRKICDDPTIKNKNSRTNFAQNTWEDGISEVKTRERSKSFILPARKSLEIVSTPLNTELMNENSYTLKSSSLPNTLLKKVISQKIDRDTMDWTLNDFMYYKSKDVEPSHQSNYTISPLSSPNSLKRNHFDTGFTNSDTHDRSSSSDSSLNGENELISELLTHRKYSENLEMELFKLQQKLLEKEAEVSTVNQKYIIMKKQMMIMKQELNDLKDNTYIKKDDDKLRKKTIFEDFFESEEDEEWNEYQHPSSFGTMERILCK